MRIEIANENDCVYVCEACDLQLGHYMRNIPLTLIKNIDGEELELHFCSEKHAIEYLQAEQNKQRG